MKTKLVLWGKNPEGEKVLLGLSLNEEDKKVNTYVFQEDVVTTELENLLHHNWKSDEEIPFPDTVKKFTKELSLIEDILPEGHTTERDDLVKRAQTEWHFVILSGKLYATYQSEIEEIKDRIERAEHYSNNLWEEMKSFWEKVQAQIVEKNLYRTHANELREMSNAIFTRLKEMRKDIDKEFTELSKNNFESFNEKLTEIDDRIGKGLSLHAIFEDLKALQKDFKDLRLIKEHRNKLWEKLDKSFKEVKEKRFGEKSGASGDNSPLNRLERRLKGLGDAIGKMEKSIKRDKADRSRQETGNNEVFGQLEQQLREARLKMIDERIDSKQQKLNDMLKTKADLEKRKEQLLAREQKQKELEEAKKEIQEKIAAEIKEAAESRKEEEKKLEELAAQIEVKAPVKKKAAAQSAEIKPDNTGSEEE